MLNAAREGQKGPVDEGNPDQFFSPLYSIAGYTNTVDDWVNTYRVTPPIEISYTDILSQPKEISARGMLSSVDDDPPLSDLQCVKLRGETEITFDINHGKPCWEDLGFQMPSGPDAGIPTHDRGGFEHTSDRLYGMPSNGGARGIHLGDESESEDMEDLFDQWFCGIESRNSGTSRGANTDAPMLMTDLVPSEEKVKVTLTISGLGLFPVQPGGWDIPNFPERYPKLQPNAPADLTTPMVKPISFLLAYGVGLKAKLSRRLYHRVQETYHKAVTQENTFLFGGYKFNPVEVGDGSPQSVGHSYKDFQMDTKKLEVKIPPMYNIYPVLLAVVGRKYHVK